MSNGWGPRALVPLMCIALAAACGGRDGENNDRPGGAERAPAAAAESARTADPSSVATVSLSGCLEAAPGSDAYVLRNVRFEPRGGGDPHRTTTTSGGQGITEGGWVRLNDGDGDRDLEQYLGQRVTVKGIVVDDGRNTIGTAGTPGVAAPSGDTSQAASPEHHSDKRKKEMGRIARESMADGTAAAVRVQEVSATGDRCVQAEDRRF